MAGTVQFLGKTRVFSKKPCIESRFPGTQKPSNDFPRHSRKRFHLHPPPRARLACSRLRSCQFKVLRPASAAIPARNARPASGDQMAFRGPMRLQHVRKSRRFGHHRASANPGRISAVLRFRQGPAPASAAIRGAVGAAKPHRKPDQSLAKRFPAT